MGKAALLIILLLFIQLSYAAETIYGEITLEVLNRPPKIKSIYFYSSEAYADTPVKCIAEIDDESPETVTVFYSWYAEETLLDLAGSNLESPEEGKKITCEAYPLDSFGKQGEKKSVSLYVKNSSATSKAIKSALNALGLKVTLAELEKDSGPAAITGYVTGESNPVKTNLFLSLAIFTLLLVSINLFGLFNYLKRKPKSPRQDFSPS